MYLDMSQGTPKSKLRDQIDENLKRIYDETLNEQIPDRLTQLLEQLRKKSESEPGSGDRGLS
jgi:hemerythrin-like domain-containing protein